MTNYSNESLNRAMEKLDTQIALNAMLIETLTKNIARPVEIKSAWVEKEKIFIEKLHKLSKITVQRRTEKNARK